MNQQRPGIRTYTWTAAALLVLLALTLVVGALPLGPSKPAFTLAIAVAKASLVVLIFMHIRYERPVMRLFAVAGLAWLAILMTLTLADTMSRMAN